MFCEACGERLRAGARFCGNCGQIQTKERESLTKAAPVRERERQTRSARRQAVSSVGGGANALGAPTRKPRRLLAGGLAVILCLLVAAQVALPRIATDGLRSRLGRHGEVLAVSVSAFPALELLWGHADSVTLTMRSYGSAPTATPDAAALQQTDPTGSANQLDPQMRLANLLASTASTNSLEARIEHFRSGRVSLNEVVLTKHGSQLEASGLLTSAALRAALPDLLTLVPLSSPRGELLFRAGADVLGVRASVAARLVAHKGAVVIQPDLVGLFPSFFSITIFRDPRILVESVHSQAVKLGWQLTATARLQTS